MEGNINPYCLKHYDQSLQHQRGMEQPQSTNPVDGTEQLRKLGKN